MLRLRSGRWSVLQLPISAYVSFRLILCLIVFPRVQCVLGRVIQYTDDPSFQGLVFVGPSLDLSSVSAVVVVPVYPVPAVVYVFNCSPDVYFFIEHLATALFECIEFDPLCFPPYLLR